MTMTIRRGTTQVVESGLAYRVDTRGKTHQESILLAPYRDARDSLARWRIIWEPFGPGSGQKFPGQVFLSGVVAGGRSPVTHVISVGMASEAAIEAWEKENSGSADWAAYLEASRASAQYLGGSMILDIKSWGSLSLKDVSVP